jgi:hypothetical protein
MNTKRHIQGLQFKKWSYLPHVKKEIIILIIVFTHTSPAQNIESNNEIKGEKIMEKVRQFDSEISGKYFRYTKIAYIDFEKKQKNIDDFKILIRDDNQQIEIIFIPNLAPGENPSLGGETSLGHAVTYLISKKDNTIIRSYRHR